MRVVITGASGNIGGKLARHLRARGYDLCLIDRVGDDPAIVKADLASDDAGWTELLAPGDIVVHLAAEAHANAGWDALIGPNLDAVLNLYAAAARVGVARIVFASSVWGLHGHRGDAATPLAATTPPDPGGNAYGATKLFGERIAAAFARHWGVATIAVRIGNCRPHNHDMRSLASSGSWGQHCWLSDDDCVRGLEAAIACAHSGFAVINLVSWLDGGRWSMAETEVLTGFTAKHRYRPAAGVRTRMRDRLARIGWTAAARLPRFLINRDL